MNMIALRFLSPSSQQLSITTLSQSSSASNKTQKHVWVFHQPRKSLAAVNCTSSENNSSSTSSDDVAAPQPRVTPPDALKIRFRTGSRRRLRQREDGFENRQASKAVSKDAVPKKWEEMSVMEKAMELYMGEKGLLFWLNKFAYASIFIVIGVWILFRFVGPSLNLYQLDTPPLSPSNMFKG